MEVGKHDVRGACAPGGEWAGAGKYRTFSLGVFEWVPKGNGKGTKKGPVKVRVSGSTENHAAVFAKAREIAAALDAGAYSGPKAVNLP